MIFENKIDPVLFELGPLSIRYYGLFIVIGILFALLIWKLLLKDNPKKFDILFDLLVWLIIGGVIGARLGHVFFYEWSYYAQNPFDIIMIQKGGLSSHGLTIGLVLAFFFFVKIKKINLADYLDIVIVPIPILVFLIRSANFINSEIVGRPTNSNWGVRYYLFEADPVLRHPSQIYEALLGLIIFVIVFLSYRYYNLEKKKPYFTFAIFLCLYFTSRFLVEFFKEYQTLEPPGLTMGQYLSLPIAIFGIVFLGYLIFKKRSQNKKSSN